MDECPTEVGQWNFVSTAWSLLMLHSRSGPTLRRDVDQTHMNCALASTRSVTVSDQTFL